MNIASKKWTLFAAVGLLTATWNPGVAVAGPHEAEACAAQLSTTGLKMFHAIAVRVKPDSDIASLMREHVRPMVMGGRISREQAEHNAPSVAKCLQLLR